MCIIAICVKRKLTTEELRQCWTCNRDGAGIAFPVSDTDATLVKGFMRRKELERFYDTVDTLPHVVHFRVASSGGVRPELTHPFLCTPDSDVPLSYTGSDMLLFHNGIALDWHKLGDKHNIPWNWRWSDTRVISAVIGRGTTPEELLPTAGGKFVTMQGRSVWRYGEFEEADGVLFSNGSYKRSRWQVWRGGRWLGADTYGTPEDDVERVQCSKCDRTLWGDMEKARGTCWWCNQDKYECSECGEVRYYEGRTWCPICGHMTDGRKRSEHTSGITKDTLDTASTPSSGTAPEAGADTRDHGDAGHCRTSGATRPLSCFEYECMLYRNPRVCRNCIKSTFHQERERGH